MASPMGLVVGGKQSKVKGLGKIRMLCVGKKGLEEKRDADGSCMFMFVDCQ